MLTEGSLWKLQGCSFIKKETSQQLHAYRCSSIPLPQLLPLPLFFWLPVISFRLQASLILLSSLTQQKNFHLYWLVKKLTYLITKKQKNDLPFPIAVRHQISSLSHGNHIMKLRTTLTEANTVIWTHHPLFQVAHASSSFD